MISIFDMFKIGIGPSSSHTVGPMRAGALFRQQLINQGLLNKITRFRAHVYGSLSFTGRGHGTDSAIIGGLAGYEPDTVDTTTFPEFIRQVMANKILPDINGHQTPFDYMHDFRFHSSFLPLHENGMRLEAFIGNDIVAQEVYYSIGGGFVVTEKQFAEAEQEQAPLNVPYPYRSAADLIRQCKEHNLSLSEVIFRNECALRPEEEVRAYAHAIWQTMRDCIQRGLNTEGTLPGPLHIQRRAPLVKKQLESSAGINSDPMGIVDWINMTAFAVNEENAAGGRVVTAPTNGACGIVPTVLAYYDHFVSTLTDEQVLRYLLTCSAIGSLYKMNASISGAEVGCQGEVGVACSMAAAGLTELQGGSPDQVCIAAEIAMEHHLGLTCDPVNGQVQVPCIERNAMSSVKAINASRMALRRTTEPAVTLDEVIATMYETGRDMHQKYRETSIGGLAKHVLC
ncbi:L-serine ammonia-lyase [Eikenella sp. S3360]|uniref:L-serine dehydratase n=1 Tax=Eikenella glucosivorans TaxID=2766967 RepID=A0ABS0NA50_9NEIS|nr:L-serine ammonia-lyase [Eikenella glucosivorans]MBH5329175.1 L-serine ammonia-lyase [Eikenella glucosivorans]